MTIKTLEELNLEFMKDESVAERPPGDGVVQQKADKGISKETTSTKRSGKKKRGQNSAAFQQTDAKRLREKDTCRPSALARASYILLCLAVLIALFAVVTSSKYSFFNVLTSSMQGEIPKGSLILVHQTDPQELEVGDNITFMRGWKTSITHKIEEIYENYQTSGARGFQTKGVNNMNADTEIVHEDNVVGKVVFVIPSVGAAVTMVITHSYVMFIIIGLSVILSLAVYIKRRQKTAAATSEITE